MASNSLTAIPNFTLDPVEFENVETYTGNYGITRFKITTNTGVYTGNIELTLDSKAVPHGLGRWVPKENNHLYGLWEKGVFICPPTNYGTPVIAKNN
jgi:hypothetical protein